MKQLLSFIILTTQLYSNSAYSQPLCEINNYLKSAMISEVAKNYYKGEFRASDDDSTIGIIDSINTTNHFTRPFYLLLVSKIMVHSDGALSEVLSLSCKDFFEKHPDYLIEFLYGNHNLIQKE